MLVVLCLSASGMYAQDWVQYQSEECNCIVQFPASPELDPDTEDGITTHELMSEYQGGIYSFYYTFSKEAPMLTPGDEYAARITEEAMDDFVAGINGTITKKKKWKVNGKQGWASTVLSDDLGGGLIYYNNVMLDGIFYQMIVIDLDGEGKKTAKTFLKSFEVL